MKFSHLKQKKINMVDISKKKSPKGKHMHHQQLFFLKKLLKNY